MVFFSMRFVRLRLKRKNFVGGSFFRKVAGYRLAALLEIDAGYSEYRCITSALLSEQVAG